MPPLPAIAERAPASPLTTTSPPRIEAPVELPLFPPTTMLPSIMSAPSDQPGVAVDGNVQPVREAAAEVADVAAKPDGRAGMVEEAHRQAVPRARVQDVHRSGSAVQQLPQAFVDLARAEAVRVHRGRR